MLQIDSAAKTGFTYPGSQNYNVSIGTPLDPLIPSNPAATVVYGQVSTVAGTGQSGSAKGVDVSFYNPVGVMKDVFGNIYVADTDNYKIRKIDPSGVVTVFAGS